MDALSRWQTWAAFVVTLILIIFPLWAVWLADNVVVEQSWLLFAIAYLLVVLTITAFGIYTRMGHILDALKAQPPMWAPPPPPPSLTVQPPPPRPSPPVT
jgi:hypothetical protein